MPSAEHIEVSRTLPFAATQIFDAWLAPETLGQWLFATPAGRMERVELEPREGGNFLIAERRGAALAEHHGTFVALDRPHRIVFDFSADPTAAPTRVTVTLDPVPDGTTVSLTHALAPEWASFAERSRQGWRMILEALEDTLAGGRTLVLARTLDATPHNLFRAWTEPALIKQWFTPKPVETTECSIDLRPGGAFRTIMKMPDGQLHPNVGCILEVIPDEKLVFTSALSAGFRPNPAPFLAFTAILTFADAGNGQTAYVARALHGTAEDSQRHAAMGFHDGWNAATSQLEAVAKTLP